MSEAGCPLPTGWSWVHRNQVVLTDPAGARRWRAKKSLPDGNYYCVDAYIDEVALLCAVAPNAIYASVYRQVMQGIQQVEDALTTQAALEPPPVEDPSTASVPWQQARRGVWKR